jgi:hypothetical protein
VRDGAAVDPDCAQKATDKFDYHSEWGCVETDSQGRCTQRTTTDFLGDGSIIIALEDDHLDVSEAWRPAAFLPFLAFLSPKNCTIMRGSYDNCNNPEARYHRNETRVLRHLAEGIIRTFIRD